MTKEKWQKFKGTTNFVEPIIHWLKFSTKSMNQYEQTWVVNRERKNKTERKIRESGWGKIWSTQHWKQMQVWKYKFIFICIHTIQYNIYIYIIYIIGGWKKGYPKLWGWNYQFVGSLTFRGRNLSVCFSRFFYFSVRYWFIYSTTSYNCL